MSTLRILFLVLLQCCFSNGIAQKEDTLKQIVEKVFYEEKVYSKLFMEHNDYVNGPSILLLPNAPLARKYPNLFNEIDINSWVGSKRYAMIYLKRELGAIIITIPEYDADHVLFVGINKFSYSSTEASVVFHTTSRQMNDSLADRYIKVTCSLERKKNEWKIKKLKIEQNNCCEDYDYDMNYKNDGRYRNP